MLLLDFLLVRWVDISPFVGTGLPCRDVVLAGVRLENSANGRRRRGENMSSGREYEFGTGRARI